LIVRYCERIQYISEQISDPRSKTKERKHDRIYTAESALLLRSYRAAINNMDPIFRFFEPGAPLSYKAFAYFRESMCRFASFAASQKKCPPHRRKSAAQINIFEIIITHKFVNLRSEATFF